MFSWLGNHAAEVIAICALSFTAYQAFLQRQHNRVSVKPHLSLFTETECKDGFGDLNVTISNNGLGPAFINKYQPFSKGSPCKPEDALGSVITHIPAQTKYTTLAVGHSIPQNEPLSLLKARFPCKNEQELEAIKQQLDKLDLVIEYSCAYGRSFKLDTRKGS